MHFLRAGWTIVALLALTAPAAAQDIASPYRYIELGQEASAFVGVLEADAGRFGFGPSSGPLYGVRYGLELSGPVALEAVSSFVSTERDVVNPGRPEGDRVVDEAEIDLLFVDARVRFALTGRRTWNRMQPFLYGGIGLAFNLADFQREDQVLDEADRFDFGTEIVPLLGAGARIFLNERVAIRTEAQLTLYRLDVPEGFRDPARGFENVAESEWVNSGVFTVGLAYLF